MRFFDEDNRQFEWTLVIIGLILVLYVGSFAVIRVNATSDFCGVQWVEFPSSVRTFYNPIIIWDKQMNERVIYDGEEDQETPIRIETYSTCKE